MKVLERLLAGLAALVLLVLGFIGVRVWQDRDQLLQQARHALTEGVARQFGWRVQVGRIEGPFWREIRVHDVTLEAGLGPSAPRLGHARRIVIRFHPLHVLRLGPRPIEVEVEGASLSARRLRDGRLALVPPKLPPPDPNGLKWPPLRILLPEARLSWRDDAKVKGGPIGPFARDLTARDAVVEARGDVWTWRTSLREGAISATLSGSHHALAGTGDLAVAVDGPIGASWFPYLFPPEKQTFLAGDARVRLGLHYEARNPKAFRMAGTVVAEGIRMRQKGVRLPLEDGRLDLVLTERLLDFRTITGRLAGNTFSAKGKVTLGPLRPPLSMEVDIPRIELASLTPLLPELAEFKLAGLARATASVRGDTLAPATDISISTRNSKALGAPVDEAAAIARIRGDQVDVPDIRISGLGGIATGSARFGLLPGSALAADLDFDGIDPVLALAPYVKVPSGVRGKLGGHARVRGGAGRPRTDIALRGRGLGVRSQGIERLVANIGIDPDGTHLEQARIDTGGGGLVVRGHLDRQRRLQGRVTCEDVPLAALTGMGLRTRLKGRLGGEALVDLPLDRPEAWRGQAKLSAQNLEVEGFGLPVASTRIILDGNLLALAELEAHPGGSPDSGHIRGSGFVRLPVGRQTLHTHLDLVAHDLELAGLSESLQRQVPAAAALNGRVDIPFATVDAGLERWQVATRVRVESLDAPEWGKLDQADLQLVLTPETLRVPEGLLSAGGQDLRVTGTVALQPGHVHDLDLPIQELDLQAFLKAFHWDRMLEGTILAGALGTPQARGTTRPWVALPERSSRTTAFRDPWQEAFAHWLRNHKVPDPPDPRAVLGNHPIWEEVRGQVTGHLHLSGDFRHPRLGLDLGSSLLSVYGHPVAVAPMQLTVSDQRADLRGLDLSADNGLRIRGEGTLGGSGMDVTFDGVDLAWADPWLRSRNLTLTGLGSARIRITGNPAAPVLGIEAKATSGTLDVLKYDEARVVGRYQDGRLTLDDAVMVAEDKRTRLSGTIPLDGGLTDEPMALSLGVEGPSLGLVSTLTKGLVEWQGGDGFLRLRILGSRSAPRLAGILELNRARLGIRTLTEPLTDVGLQAIIGDGIVKISKAEARLGGGRVTAAGYVTMKQFALDGLDVSAQVREARVALRSGLYDGQVDAALRIGGTLKRPVIAGQVAASKGTLDLGVDTPKDEDEEASTPVILDRLVVSIKDTMRVFQPNLMDLRIAGNLIVEGLLDLPDPKGLITVVPGGKVTTFYTNDFRVTEGTVEFVGSGRSDLGDLRGPRPTVKQLLAGTRIRVVATGNVRDTEGLRPAADGTANPLVTVRAIIQGTLANLKNEFTSDPLGYTHQELERLVGKPQLVSNLFVLAQGNVASASTDIAREVAPGLVNFALNRFVQPLVDPLTRNLYLSDLSFDIVNGARTTTGVDPNQGLLAGFNMALTGETIPLGPLSGSGRYVFRRGAQALGAQNNVDLWRAGVNVQLAQNLALTTQLEQADRLATANGVGFPAIQSDLRQWLNPDLAANTSTEFILSLQLRWRGRF
ncbi:MAG: translocation/assembly module TamB domain-containing protein [Candidatus Sericytochromatia bacterium]|nr:translocation/assembly module TamB domain-containing protein [Candidatus Sericytochromatia bacterium]